MIVHLGVVIVAVAIADQRPRPARGRGALEPGQTRDRRRARDHLPEHRGRAGAQPQATKVRVRVDGGQVYEPALSQYPGFGPLIGTPSVRTGLTRGRVPHRHPPARGGVRPVTLRVIIQPMALWLWIGGGVMAFGTVLAAWPGRRRRRPTDPVSAPVPVEDAPRARSGRWARRDRRRAATRRRPEEPRPARAPRCSPRSSSPCSSPCMVAVLATRTPSTERATQSPLHRRAGAGHRGRHHRRRGLDIDDQRGRWVMLNFFASWCTPCLEEHPELNAFDVAHRAEGDAALVGVTFDDKAEEAREFFEEHGGDWPVIDDPRTASASPTAWRRCPRRS